MSWVCFASSSAAARVLSVGLAVSLCAANLSMAQSVKGEPSTGPATKQPAPAALPGPAWAALTPLQRQALAPLAGSWDSLSSGQQRKWLEVSRNYPALAVADQAKMHGRMSEWVSLSPRERSAARLNFAATTEIAKELSAEEKKAKWDAYQALSPEERQKFANQGSRPPLGAAPATRPVAQQKLVTLPNSANATTATPRNPKLATESKKEEAKPLTGPSEAASTPAAASYERSER